jgi:hypothetical protein
MGVWRAYVVLIFVWLRYRTVAPGCRFQGRLLPIVPGLRLVSLDPKYGCNMNPERFEAIEVFRGHICSTNL